MSISGVSTDDDSDVMSEINMIPLVDIMLVLLIVFIITAPVMHHTLNLSLPQETSQPQELLPSSIQLGIQADGNYFWNSEPVTESELLMRLEQAAQQSPQPALHLSADKNARYEFVIHALNLVQQAPLTQIGFVTDPKE